MLQGGAQIGLMARGDLSDNAAFVMVDIDGSNGLHVDDQPVPGITQDHQRGLGGTAIFSSSTKPVANWLLKPIRLRLARQDSVWTAYTSLDGISWQAGKPVQGIQMAGCWVGLFVNNKNSSHPPILSRPPSIT